MLVINVRLIDVVGLIILLSFFSQIKKKGDDKLRFPKLALKFITILVIGKNNNISLNKKANIKK